MKSAELLKLQKKASSLQRVYRAVENRNEPVVNALPKLKSEYIKVNAGVLEELQKKNKMNENEATRAWDDEISIPKESNNPVVFKLYI